MNIDYCDTLIVVYNGIFFITIESLFISKDIPGNSTIVYMKITYGLLYMYKPKSLSLFTIMIPNPIESISICPPFSDIT